MSRKNGGHKNIPGTGNPNDWIITDHAVEQFIRRWRPESSPEQAREEIGSLLRTSAASGKTPIGDAIRVSGHFPDIRFVVKDRVVCVTTLPSMREGGSDPDDLDWEDWDLDSGGLPLDKPSNALIEQLEREIEEVERQRVALEEKRKQLGFRKSQLHNELIRARVACCS